VAVLSKGKLVSRAEVAADNPKSHGTYFMSDPALPEGFAVLHAVTGALLLFPLVLLCRHGVFPILQKLDQIYLSSACAF
jgi:hypothetical protein